jgi:hypothetical protein
MKNRIPPALQRNSLAEICAHADKIMKGRPHGTIRTKLAGALWIAAFLTLPAFAVKERPMLLQEPSISGTTVVFSFAGDLWTAPRDGGSAGRLTTWAGSRPLFSPDRNLVAFTGQ